MKNLNKFTKTELINKMNDLQNKSNNKSTLIKIVEFIIFLKNWIIRLTLIALIIKWFKNYSLFRKTFHIFSWIASTLLGISLIDIYSLDVITWIKETNIYNWIYDLFYSKENSSIIKSIKEVKANKEVKKEDTEFQFPKTITSKTDGNEKTHVTLSEWFNRDINKEVITDDSLIDKIKDNSKNIIIISGVVIISGLSYYYFNEIKDGFGTSINWIKNYLFGPSSDPGTNASNSDILNSTQSSRDNLKIRFLKLFRKNEEEQEIIDLLPPSIELSDLKGKQILTDQDITSENMKKFFTSPSLESLNNRATEAWTDPLSDSSSNSSSSTITPSNYKPEVSSENITSNIPSSSQNLQATSSTHITPSETLLNVISNSWKDMINKDNKELINFIDNFVSSKQVVTDVIIDKLINDFINIISNYDNQVNLYYINSNSNWTSENANNFKIGLYFYKKWIKKNMEIIFPDFNKLQIGNITDEPNRLSEWLISVI